jgi:hypothetical protein
VAHLVDVDGDDEASREFPAEGHGVDPQRHGHRQERLRLKETREKQLALAEQKEDPPLELGEERAERADAGEPLVLARTRARRAGGLTRTGRRWGRGRELRAQGLHLREDALVLTGALGQELQHAAPRGERPGQVTLRFGALCLGGEALQLLGVDELAAARARKNRRGNFSRAPAAKAPLDETCRACDHGPARAGAPMRNGPEIGTLRLIFHAS